MEPLTIISAAAPVVGAIVWLVRLEGRLNVQDTLHAVLKEDITEIKQDVKTLIREVRNGHAQG